MDPSGKTGGRMSTTLSRCCTQSSQSADRNAESTDLRAEAEAAAKPEFQSLGRCDGRDVARTVSPNLAVERSDELERVGLWRHAVQETALREGPPIHAFADMGDFLVSALFLLRKELGGSRCPIIGDAGKPEKRRV